jgi:hypothetical protein
MGRGAAAYESAPGFTYFTIQDKRSLTVISLAPGLPRGRRYSFPCAFRLEQVGYESVISQGQCRSACAVPRTAIQDHCAIPVEAAVLLIGVGRGGTVVAVKGERQAWIFLSTGVPWKWDRTRSLRKGPPLRRLEPWRS